MMPKVTLKAPAGVGGTIHASKSGKNYTIAEDGTVTVDSVDVGDLTSAGYQALPHDGGPDSEASAPITSHSTTADIQGATALDPDRREALRREEAAEDGQHNEDHGKAIPPHGTVKDLGNDPTVQAHKQADADLTAETSLRSDAPAAAKSPEANTGSAEQPAGSQTQQDRAVARVEDGKAPPSRDPAAPSPPAL